MGWRTQARRCAMRCGCSKRHGSDETGVVAPSNSWRCDMAKLIAQTFLTIDGVMESPDKWQLQNGLFDDKMGEPIGGAFQSAGALLLGRVTYQEFAAHCPNQKDDPFADLLNDISKYVVSNTLKTVTEWKNSQVV